MGIFLPFLLLYLFLFTFLLLFHYHVLIQRFKRNMSSHHLIDNIDSLECFQTFFLSILSTLLIGWFYLLFVLPVHSPHLKIWSSSSKFLFKYCTISRHKIWPIFGFLQWALCRVLDLYLTNLSLKKTCMDVHLKFVGLIGTLHVHCSCSTAPPFD